MKRIAIVLLTALACAPAWSQGGSAAWVPLFDGRTLQGWKETPFGRHGTVEAKDGVILLGIGRQTGVTWTGDFPRTDYEVRFEAVRLEGNDFFAGITFPVKDSHCSWINGGWGGTVVGLSSLDGDDASENETSTIFEFEQGRWYAFRLEVTKDRIKGWIDGELIIDADIAGRRVELRPGESDLGIPLGFSSYWTKAGVRKIEYRRLGSAVKQEPRTGAGARAPGV